MYTKSSSYFLFFFVFHFFFFLFSFFVCLFVCHAHGKEYMILFFKCACFCQVALQIWDDVWNQTKKQNKTKKRSCCQSANQLSLMLHCTHHTHHTPHTITYLMSRALPSVHWLERRHAMNVYNTHPAQRQVTKQSLDLRTYRAWTIAAANIDPACCRYWPLGPKKN